MYCYRPPVTGTWRLERGTLTPTRRHLAAHCRRVASICIPDREIRFSCAGATIPVHLSRIQIHGGPLLELVETHVSQTSDYVVTVPMDETAMAFRPVADFLYRSQIVLDTFSVPQAVEVALTACRWQCVDLYKGIMIHFVNDHLLTTGTEYAVAVPLLWFPHTPPAFTTFFFLNVASVVPEFTLEEAVEVLFAAFRKDRAAQSSIIFEHVMHANILQDLTHIVAFLPIFRHMVVPSFFREYFSMSIAPHFDALSADMGDASLFQRFMAPLPPHDGEVSSDTYVLGRTFKSSFEEDLAPVDSQKELWYILSQSEMVPFTVKNIILHSQYKQGAFLMILLLKYVEPYIADDKVMLSMLFSIRIQVKERQALLDINSLYEKLSKRAMRLMAFVVHSPCTFNVEGVLPMTVKWEWLKEVGAERSCSATLNKVNFQLRLCHIPDSGCSIRLGCSGDGNCLAEKQSVHFSYRAMDIDCRCNCMQSLQKIANGVLVNFSSLEHIDNSVRFETECVLLDEEEISKWCDMHAEGCQLHLNVRLEIILKL